MGESKRIITITIKKRGPYTRIVTKEHELSGCTEEPRLILINTFIKTVTRKES